MQIGILIGSTRPGRVATQVADWALERLQALPNVDVDLIDLATEALPMLDEPEHPAAGDYRHAHTRRWRQRIARLDGYVFVTPEYNYSFSAPLKNALDYLSAEWRLKPVAMVAYGMTSGGTRSVSALAPVLNALGIISVGAVHLHLRDRLSVDEILQPTDSDRASLEALLLELTTLADVLEPLRAAALST